MLTAFLIAAILVTAAVSVISFLCFRMAFLAIKEPERYLQTLRDFFGPEASWQKQD